MERQVDDVDSFSRSDDECSKCVNTGKNGLCLIPDSEDNSSLNMNCAAENLPLSLLASSPSVRFPSGSVRYEALEQLNQKIDVQHCDSIATMPCPPDSNTFVNHLSIYEFLQRLAQRSMVVTSPNSVNSCLNLDKSILNMNLPQSILNASFSLLSNAPRYAHISAALLEKLAASGSVFFLTGNYLDYKTLEQDVKFLPADSTVVDVAQPYNLVGAQQPHVVPLVQILTQNSEMMSNFSYYQKEEVISQSISCRSRASSPTAPSSSRTLSPSSKTDNGPLGIENTKELSKILTQDGGGCISEAGSLQAEMEKFSTREIAQQVAVELRRYSIPQAVFSHLVLGRSQGTLSDLLRNPKPWSKLKAGRETFRRMWKWLKQPEHERLAALRTLAPGDSGCHGSRGHASFRLDDGVQKALKKPRLVFTEIQRRTLVAIFKEIKRPSKEIQATIAEQLGLKASTVANFFMNARRRSVEKYADEDEPLSSEQQNSSSAPVKCSQKSDVLVDQAVNDL